MKKKYILLEKNLHNSKKSSTFAVNLKTNQKCLTYQGLGLYSQKTFIYKQQKTCQVMKTSKKQFKNAAMQVLCLLSNRNISESHKAYYY